MQSARIWFRRTSPAFTLDDARATLEQQGARVEPAAWQLGDFIIPQLRILHPAQFLMQIDDDPSIVEDAEEFAGYGGVPDTLRARLAQCDTRLDFGDEGDTGVQDGVPAVVFAVTTFDPAEPAANALLRHLARVVDGILEDNVNGEWWVP